MTQWTGADQVLRNMELFAERVRQTTVRFAKYWAVVLETEAKENAPWEDHTGNARQGLHAFVDELSNDIVTLYLSHGVEYGKWLEIRWAGRYAIIWPTIEAHLDQMQQMLQEVFG